jgi:poly(3-hydroxybutyrate) depolymerase
MKSALLLFLISPLARPAEDAHVALPVVLHGGLPGSRALVVALHGGSFTGRPPLERAQQLLLELSSEARRAGLRLLVPVGPEPPSGEEHLSPWLLPAGEALVWQVLAAETADRRADPSRLYLLGHGAGATGALTLASRRPALLAGVAAFSGTPAPLWDQDRHVIGLSEPVVEGLQRVPVFLFTARDDPLLDREALRFFVEGMTSQQKQRGGPGLTWLEGEGGHGLGSNGPARALRFLREHQLRGPATPRPASQGVSMAQTN